MVRQKSLEVLILEALRICAAVTLQLRFNPIDRGSIAVRALPAVTKLSQSLDSGFVSFQIQPVHKHQKGIVLIFGGGTSLRRGGCCMSYKEEADGNQVGFPSSFEQYSGRGMFHIPKSW